jgi:hypothetical protein
MTRVLWIAGLGLAALVSSGGSATAQSADAQIQFGIDMARRGLWSEALFRFKQAERVEPGSFRIYNNLAVAYEANGLFDEALDYYQRALQAAPSNRELRRNYSRFIEFYQSFKPRDEQPGAPEAEAAPEAATGDDSEGGSPEPGATPPEPGIPPPLDPGAPPPPEPTTPPEPGVPPSPEPGVPPEPGASSGARSGPAGPDAA